MITLKYDGTNKFQSTCFIILKNEKEVGYCELIKDNGKTRNLTLDELNKRPEYNTIINLRESI